MGETVLDQFGFKRFSYKSQSEVKSTVMAPPPVGSCEFVGDSVALEGLGLNSKVSKNLHEKR